MIELDTGDVQAAARFSEVAVQLGKRYGHSEITSTGYRVLGDIFFYLGDYTASAIDPLFRLWAVEVITGKDLDATQRIREVIHKTEDLGLGVIWLHARLSLLQIYFIQQNWATALALGNELLTDALNRKTPSLTITVRSILAAIALQRGDLQQAIQTCRENAEASADLSHPWLELRSRALLAKALQNNGERDPHNIERCTQILDHLQSNTRNEEYEGAFARFRAGVWMELGLESNDKTDLLG
jgi:hypothetical protein